MTARLITEMWCDRCGHNLTVGTIDDVADLRRVAASGGWSNSPGYADTEDLCRACTANRPARRPLPDNEVASQLLVGGVLAHDAFGSARAA